MPLKVDNTEITQLFVDGKECKVLYINNVPYFGKKYSLSPSTTGVIFSVTRIESPYQRAATGPFYSGDGIYEGDTIELHIEPENGYINAELYVDLGDGQGEQLRPNTFTFTVVGNVTFRAVAQSVILFSGTQAFTSNGSFTVPGLTGDMDISVSATGIFQEDIYDDYAVTTKHVPVSVVQGKLPLTIADNGAAIYLSHYDDQIAIYFSGVMGAYKGSGLNITPVYLAITEVRLKT